MQIFKGKISNVNKQVLSHTSGGSVWTTASGEVKGTSVYTHHEHYTDFELDGRVFRCYGDYIFRNGDSVAFVATQTNQGFYLIRMLKNVTSNFYFSEFKKRFPLFVFLKKFLSIFIISAIIVAFTSDALYNAIMTQFDLSFGFGIGLYRVDFGLLLTIIAAIVGFLVGAFAYRKVSKERKIISYCEKEIKGYMG